MLHTQTARHALLRAPQGVARNQLMLAIFAEGEKQFPSSPHVQIMYAMYLLCYENKMMAEARKHIEKARSSNPSFMMRVLHTGAFGFLLDFVGVRL